MNELDKNILKASLEYLFWFSRFEYLLKEFKLIQKIKKKDNTPPALPDWVKFTKSYQLDYTPSNNAKELIKLHPKQQIIKNNSPLEVSWEPANISKCKKVPLCEVVAMLKAVRNNVFHGGKHTSENLNSKERNLELIKTSILVIQEIAEINHFGGETFKPSQNFNFKEEVFKQSD